ncbi:MAG: sensor histidine kinase [Anaerolinea sp.]|nr:sensor histidine kinase [Anaerolinea sp.]
MSATIREKIQTLLPTSVNLVFFITAATGYIPALFSAELYTWPWWRILLLPATAVLYLTISIRGWDYLVEQSTSSWRHALYFLIQVPFVIFIIWFTMPVSNTNWILMMPIAGQSMGFRWWAVLAVCLGLLGGFGLVLAAYIPLSALLGTLSTISAAILFVLLFTRVTLRESIARAEIETLANKLQTANQQLREYAVQAEELATTKERNRLAREIHDSLGHYLTVINVQLSAAQIVLEKDPARALDALQKSQKLAQDGLSEVRRSVASLRDSPIDKRPLPDAIHELVAENRATGIVTEFIQQGEEYPLPAQTKLTLYRAVQEGLTNARKHAHASRVDVLLDYCQLETIGLTIVDNGVGTKQIGDGFGLMGLQERVQLLGGVMAVETAVGAGFRLHISLPT